LRARCLARPRTRCRRLSRREARSAARRAGSWRSPRWTIAPRRDRASREAGTWPRTGSSAGPSAARTRPACGTARRGPARRRSGGPAVHGRCRRRTSSSIAPATGATLPRARGSIAAPPARPRGAEAALRPAAWARGRSRGARETLDDRDQLLVLERLFHVCGRARLQPALRLLVAALGRDEHDGNPFHCLVLLHRLEQLEAVHARHVDVEQDEVDVEVLGQP